MQENITAENSPEKWTLLFKFWEANHRPGKFYQGGTYYLALRDNENLTFVQLGRPNHEDSSFGV